ncbi:MAG: glycosyltransferase, partial [Bacteroidales bacterium]|nr:glycosyltransferase [Bacteroidales bacterium]
SNPIEMLSWVFHAIKYLKSKTEINYDLCLSHYAIPGGLVAYFLKLKYKIPYIIISHGEDIPFLNKKVMLKYHIFTYYFLKLIFANSLNNIVLTNYLKLKLDKFLKSGDKSIVIPNGSNEKLFFPDYSKRSKNFKIIYVGRLADVKEPFVFLEAINMLSKRNIEFTVNILGDGPLKEKAENYVKKNNLSEIIKFKGWISKEEIAEEYQSSHMQVISSRFEAFSISALESLFSGVYILSTPVSGNTDIIKKGVNGDFYNFKDSFILANKIENFYNTEFKNSYKINEEFLENFRKMYSWNNIITQYDKLLSEINTEKN